MVRDTFQPNSAQILGSSSHTAYRSQVTPVCCSPGWEVESLVATLPDLWELLAGCWDCNVHCRCRQYSSPGLPESLGSWELLFCVPKAPCCELHNEHKFWEGYVFQRLLSACLEPWLRGASGEVTGRLFFLKGTETRGLGRGDDNGSDSQLRC